MDPNPNPNPNPTIDTPTSLTTALRLMREQYATLSTQVEEKAGEFRRLSQQVATAKQIHTHYERLLELEKAISLTFRNFYGTEIQAGEHSAPLADLVVRYLMRERNYTRQAFKLDTGWRGMLARLIGVRFGPPNVRLSRVDRPGMVDPDATIASPAAIHTTPPVPVDPVDPS